MKYFFVVLCITLVLCSCAGKKQEAVESKASHAITNVKLATVTEDTVDETYSITATIKAENVTTLTPMVVGEVKTIKVKTGDYVKAGQVLMAIDDAQYAQKVAQAESALAEALAAVEMARESKRLATTTHERFRKLHDEKVITSQEFDEIALKTTVSSLTLAQGEAAVKRASAALSEAKLFLGYTKIVAPFNGVIGRRMVDVGVIVAPGSPLMVIEDTSSYSIQGSVDERFSRFIKTGMKVNVYIDALSINMPATVTEVSSLIDTSTRTFPVKIAIDNPRTDVRSGFYATISLPIAKKQAIMVPATAIVERGQLKGVYAVRNGGSVVFTLVKTGDVIGGKLEILSGLNAGDTIATDNLDNVTDGGKVEGSLEDGKDRNIGGNR